MDFTVIFIVLAVTMAVVTLQAWRLGCEKRDIALLGTTGGLLGLGAAVSAVA